jgi:hypothetical protein
MENNFLYTKNFVWGILALNWIFFFENIDGKLDALTEGILQKAG